jgi:DNA-directed RNA polymerase specialized sigma24 family protein
VHIIDPAGQPASLQHELLAIRQDPQVVGIARRWAGDPYLAEDALQIAYYKVATAKNPEGIDNPRAYYVRVLQNEIKTLFASRQVISLENPEAVLDAGQRGIVVCGPVRSRPVADTVCTLQLARSLRARLAAQRKRLVGEIAARSDDPGRYRTVIYDSAGQVLLDGLNGEASDSDSNGAFRAAYPEYFAQPGASADLLYQRFRRARLDVKALLKAVVDRRELI